MMLMNLTLINSESILLPVMITRLYALTKDLANQCKHIKAQMKFKSLLKKRLKKLDIVKKLCQKNFKEDLAMIRENERYFRKAN